YCFEDQTVAEAEQIMLDANVAEAPVVTREKLVVGTTSLEAIAQEIQLEIAHVLFIDIVGYSKLLITEQSELLRHECDLAEFEIDWSDAGHILVSKRVADDLEQYRQWRSHLHDLGECEVKHGVRVHVVNLYTEELGNPNVPEKLRLANEPGGGHVRLRKKASTTSL